MTLEDVAGHLGTSQPSIHRWEKGDVALPVPTWFELAKLYGAEHPAELSWPPDVTARRHARDAREAAKLLGLMTEEDREHWLALGRRAAEPKAGQNSPAAAAAPPQAAAAAVTPTRRRG